MAKLKKSIKGHKSERPIKKIKKELYKEVYLQNKYKQKLYFLLKILFLTKRIIVMLNILLISNPFLDRVLSFILYND